MNQPKTAYFGISSILIIVSTVFTAVLYNFFNFPATEGSSHDAHSATALEAFSVFVESAVIIFFGIFLGLGCAAIGLLRKEKKLFPFISIGIIFFFFCLFIIILAVL